MRQFGLVCVPLSASHSLPHSVTHPPADLSFLPSFSFPRPSFVSFSHSLSTISFIKPTLLTASSFPTRDQFVTPAFLSNSCTSARLQPQASNPNDTQKPPLHHLPHSSCVHVPALSSAHQASSTFDNGLGFHNEQWADILQPAPSTPRCILIFSRPSSMQPITTLSSSSDRFSGRSQACHSTACEPSSHLVR